MAHEQGKKAAVFVVAEDPSGSSLVPMLIGGLVLIVLAMFAALLFV
jgi:hypothetical protein